MESFLSFCSGNQIARICHGNLNNQKIMISENKTDCTPVLEPLDLLGDDFFFNNRKDNLAKLSIRDLKLIESFINTKKTKVPTKYKKSLTAANLIINENRGKSFKLYDNAKFSVLPDLTKERDVFYVTGMSGVGKTTWIANFIVEYKKQYSKNEVWIFSRKNSDENLDWIGNLNRVVIDDDILEDMPQLEEFKNCLCIFDDTDALQIKYKTLITKLKDEMLECGRDKRISVIMTSHLSTNAAATRTMINESTHFIIFPNASSNKSNLNRFLKVYCGFDTIELKKIMNLPSRWVCIHNSYPKWVCSETEIFLS